MKIEIKTGDLVEWLPMHAKGYVGSVYPDSVFVEFIREVLFPDGSIVFAKLVDKKEVRKISL